MRQLTDAARLRRFMQALGAEADREGRVYFTGGATAVLLGWRPTTIDADISIVPESDRLLRALSHLKESLHMNVELASPAHFIPELPGWEPRSPFIAREGKLSFHHYDLYSQALAKIERGHARDRQDVQEMLDRRLVDRARLLELFAQIEPELYRYPALDPPSFRRAVEEALGPAGPALG
jgi:Nucleotidyltransferase of unknown function (DUF6036)